uniref:Uncharacterized protein n=1 Tax=Cacopsylla melanoneura TaxID=428564 RepID=A0A8D8M473_9HEMI
MFISGGMQVLLKLLPGVLLCSRIISVSCQFQDNDNPHGNNSHKEIFQQEIHHKNNKADYNIILTSPKLDATGLEPARPLPLKWLDEIPKRNVVGYERRYTKFRGRYTNRIKKYTYYTPGLHPFETNHQGGNISNNWRYNNWTNHFINPGPDFSDRGRYNNRGRLKLSILETNNLGRDIISIKSRYNDSSVQKHFTSPHLNDRNNLGRRYNDFSVRGRFKAPRIKDSNRNFRNRGRFKLRRHPIDSNNQSHYFANRGDYNNFSVQEHFTSPRLKDNQDHKFVKRDFGFRGRFKALRDFGIGGGYNDSSVREQFTSPHLNDNKKGSG